MHAVHTSVPVNALVPSAGEDRKAAEQCLLSMQRAGFTSDPELVAELGTDAAARLAAAELVDQEADAEDMSQSTWELSGVDCAAARSANPPSLDCQPDASAPSYCCTSLSIQTALAATRYGNYWVTSINIATADQSCDGVHFLSQRSIRKTEPCTLLFELHTPDETVLEMKRCQRPPTYSW